MKTQSADGFSLARKLALIIGVSVPLSSTAETIFSQDFEGGLGPNESTFGAFSINDTLATLNNGTQVMGHSVAYGPLGGGATPLPTYSYYEVVLDLRGFSDAQMTFEFSGGIEKDYDGFNVMATSELEVSPPIDLIFPTLDSVFQYDADPLEQHGASSPELGATAWSSPSGSLVVNDVPATFDLSDFDDQKTIVRFQFGTDAFEGGEGVNLDNLVVEGTPLPDTDGDGMHDSYETANGLNPAVDDSLGDLDSDGVNNITEFGNCTDPNDNDTDDDGLLDGAETNTGTFVSASDAGSNPLLADTDGDGLSDGDEVSDANGSETDPNNEDTDGDNFSDGLEVDAGSDPTDPADQPDLVIVQPTFTPINSNLAGIYGPDITNPGLDYQENHYGGGIIFNNNAQNNYDVHTSGNPAPTRSATFIEPYFDHGGGGNTISSNNRVFRDGAGENFTVRVNGFVDFSQLGPGTYTIHLGADDTNFFVMDTLDGQVQSQHNCCPQDHQMSFTITQAGMFPFDNVFGEQGGGDWGDLGISGPGIPGTVALGDTDAGSPPVYPISVPLEDSDGDGMPDAYETGFPAINNLDQLSADGDFDNDGVLDLAEYEGGTDPTDDDSDNDGLTDGVETDSGTYVDANDTGTDPKNEDTDGDGLNDGAETNTGTFVSASNTGTNPLVVDTDGDTYPDGSEVEAGTDPHDANDKPGIPSPFIYYDFEEGGGDSVSDGTPNGNDGTIARGVTFVEGAPDGATPDGGARFSSGLIQIPGVDVPSDLAHRNSKPDGSYTLACWMKPDASSIGGDHFFWGQTSQGIHNGLRGSGTLHTAHWGSDFNAATVLTADEWVHAVWTYDGPTDTAYIYLNGVQNGGPFTQLGPNGSGNLILGGRNGGSENFNGDIDDVAVWQEVLGAGSIAALAAGANPNEANITDRDGDGMTDVWESQNNLNPDDPSDADEDADGDGLTNKEEHDSRLDPQSNDTDGDGLTDDVETGTGVWVDSSDTGTRARSADSDGDGLDDGAETNTGVFVSAEDAGTDPHNPDTDGDLTLDGKEVAEGFDPHNPADPGAPDYATDLVAYWPQDGNHDNAWIEDVDDYHGTVEGPDIPFAEGMFGEAAHLDGSHNIIIGGDENVFDFAGESMTVSAWFTADAITKGWQCLVAKGEGNGWRMHRRGGDNPPEMAWTGGNGDTPKNNVALTVDGETWHHVVGVTDSDTQEEILYLDGVEIARKGGATLQDRANPMKIGQNPDTGDRRWQGKIDDVAIWNRPLSEAEIAILYGEGLGGTSLGDLIFGVTDNLKLDVQATEDGKLELSWDSVGGELYNIRSEVDPSGTGEDGPITWAIYDGNQDIEATPPRNTLVIDMPAEGSRFFVVEAFPAPPESIYSDNFESGQGDWVVGSDGAAGTAWELGVPGAPGPASANSPNNCFGTNLTGNYDIDAVVWLRSPAIDLGAAGSATLHYSQFVDIEEGFDWGTITILDAADDSVIEVIVDPVDGLTPDWEEESVSLPAAAMGKSIKVEFRLTSDNLESFAGWYIDDVFVTVP